MTTTTRLYTLTEDVKLLLAALEREPIDPETGEVTEAPELRAAFEELKGTIEERIQTCMRVVADLEGDRDKCQAEAKRLAELAASRDAEARRILDTVLAVMVDTLTTSVGGTHPVKVVRDPGHVEITDASSLPGEYWRQPPPPARVPDKKALTPVLKPAPKGQGLDVPGARWVPGSFRLDRT